jgi:hypothetical protein
LGIGIVRNGVDSAAMADLISDMATLAAGLGPPPGRVGRAIQFIGLKPGDGVSTLARAFAQAVAPQARRGVWLVELDVLSGLQSETIAAHPDVYGKMGEGVRASPDGSSFFDIHPKEPQDEEAAPLLMAHPVGAQKLWVTRFNADSLKPGQTVEMSDTDAYWRGLRMHADWIVVDAPALERSDNGLIVAPRMDANILVVNAERADLEGDMALRDAVRQAGGRVAGAVLNRAPKSLLDPVRKRR